MSALLHWLTSPEWVQIVKALLHSLWQGAVLALVLAVVMRRLANPTSRYRCSLAALAAVVVAGIITWAILNTAGRSASSPASSVAAQEDQQAGEFAATTVTNPDSIIIVTANRTVAAGNMRWTAWLALVWLAGAGAMLLRAGVKSLCEKRRWLSWSRKKGFLSALSGPNHATPFSLLLPPTPPLVPG